MQKNTIVLPRAIKNISQFLDHVDHVYVTKKGKKLKQCPDCLVWYILRHDKKKGDCAHYNYLNK